VAPATGHALASTNNASQTRCGSIITPHMPNFTRNTYQLFSSNSWQLVVWFFLIPPVCPGMSLRGKLAPSPALDCSSFMAKPSRIPGPVVLFASACCHAWRHGAGCGGGAPPIYEGCSCFCHCQLLFVLSP
jgi:hypothetical protein